VVEAFSSSPRRIRHSQRKLRIPLRRHSSSTVRRDKHQDSHYHRCSSFVLWVVGSWGSFLVVVDRAAGEDSLVVGHRIADCRRIEEDIAVEGIAVVLRRSIVG